MPYVIRGIGVVGSQTHAFAGLLQTSGTFQLLQFSFSIWDSASKLFQQHRCHLLQVHCFLLVVVHLRGKPDRKDSLGRWHPSAFSDVLKPTHPLSPRVPWQ